MGCKKLDISKNYESVLTVVGKYPTIKNLQVDNFLATKKGCVNYFPFGSIMPGRSFNSGSYRFGYNTQEKTDEIKGVGNHYTAKFWEYDPRIVTRWNRDPVTYPWQSPYTINNNNPIVFTDPLGLFGSRKEARQYKKDNDLKGSINKGSDGIFAINNKKSGTSYFKDPSTDNIPNLGGRQEDGVIVAGGIIEESEGSGPTADDYFEGVEQFGKKGMAIKNADQWKYSYKTQKALENAGVQVQTRVIKQSYKSLVKGVAKKAPVIGHIMNAKEVIDGIQADGNALGANTAIEIAGVAGGAGGAWAGAAGGAMIGTAIFPGIGTVVGGVIGGVLGSWGGEEAAEAVTRGVLKE